MAWFLDAVFHHLSTWIYIPFWSLAAVDFVPSTETNQTHSWGHIMFDMIDSKLCFTGKLNQTIISFNWTFFLCFNEQGWLPFCGHTCLTQKVLNYCVERRESSGKNSAKALDWRNNGAATLNMFLWWFSWVFCPKSQVFLSGVDGKQNS